MTCDKFTSCIHGLSYSDACVSCIRECNSTKRLPSMYCSDKYKNKILDNIGFHVLVVMSCIATLGFFFILGLAMGGWRLLYLL